jgi:hypothetical protein
MVKKPWIEEFKMIEDYVPKPARSRKPNSFKGIKRLGMFAQYVPQNSRMSTSIETNPNDEFELPDEN